MKSEQRFYKGKVLSLINPNKLILFFQALLEAISITSTSTQFKIGNKSYDNAAAQTIADYLNSVACNIEVAEIDDIIAGRPEDEALRTLAIICSGLKRFDLIELNLSDNAMGAKGVESCKDLLCKKFLQV